MNKKYVLIIIVVIVILGLIVINRSRKSNLGEWDNTLQELEQTEEQGNEAINDFDSINESEDSLGQLEGETIDISDLDTMLNSADAAEKSANQAISDFDSIKESDDQLSY